MQSHWTILAHAISYLVGWAGAFFAVKTYVGNSKLERARWLTQLYERFYARNELKRVRDLLDSEQLGSLKVQELVNNEGSDFTDYLNFFEYIAYLESIKQLKRRDVNALFQFYLKSLSKHEPVRKYIRDRGKGYEYLIDLLDKK